jgi:oxygen-independent coproporphyrinogen-3 oxidase
MAVDAVDQARNAGFSNINLDLIYGIPGQSLEDLDADLQRLVSFSPEHISCYGLTIEERTVFGRWSKAGKFHEVDDETGAAHFEKVMQRLAQEGYAHYEISNFSKPGFYSRHNSSYWQQKKYLGVGPSAHSYNGISRQFNVSNNHIYIKAINSDEPYFEKEILTREDKINEYLLTSLRTTWGCDLRLLKDKLGYDIRKDQAAYLNRLVRDEYIVIEDEIMKLLHRGKFVADKILGDLVLVNPTQNDISH